MTAADLSTLTKYADRLSQCYIGGCWVDTLGEETTVLLNPGDETPTFTLRLGDERDADAAVAAAAAAFGGWMAVPLDERLLLIERIFHEVRNRRDDLALAQALTVGTPIGRSGMQNVDGPLRTGAAFIDALKNFPFSYEMGTTQILREPIGVCALIAPWNWPFGQIIQKVIPALGTGCTSVIKPSEFTPLDAVIFGEVLDAAGVPAGVVNIVQGRGPVVGERLAAHPDVALVSITGSTTAGARVQSAGAATIKRVTQELGGKSANIILPDADFARVVPAGVREACRNSGQSCSAPTRMLVPRARWDEVRELARQGAESVHWGGPLDEEAEIGPLVNKSQFDRVQGLINQAIEDGAEVFAGGPGRPHGVESGYYCRPTVLGVQDPDSVIAQTEIFGPVLVVLPYDDDDDAIRIANNSVYGLGGYVQSENLEHARQIATRIRTGTININQAPPDNSAPFGGYKRSGNGRERGSLGIEEYLETKSIVGWRG